MTWPTSPCKAHPFLSMSETPALAHAVKDNGHLLRRNITCVWPARGRKLQVSVQSRMKESFPIIGLSQITTAVMPSGCGERCISVTGSVKDFPRLYHLSPKSRAGCRACFRNVRATTDAAYHKAAVLRRRRNWRTCLETMASSFPGLPVTSRQNRDTFRCRGRRHHSVATRI